MNTDRERPKITRNHTPTTPRDSTSIMRGSSTGRRAHSGDHRGDRSRNIRDEAGTVGRSSLTPRQPVQSRIDHFFSPAPITHHDRPALTRVDNIQDGRQGDDSTLRDLQIDGDSVGDLAGDIEPPNSARTGVADEGSSDEGSSDEGSRFTRSRFTPETDDDLSDELSGWEDMMESEAEESIQDEGTDWDEGEADVLLEASDELQKGNTQADSLGHQPCADTDIYSTVSGMKLVVVDCFEELFTPERDELDGAREIRDAINTGMDRRWPFIEAARAHRALKTCMHLEPGTLLYGRLFMRLASALIKAFKLRGTLDEQKCVFLMEATRSFEVHIEESIPSCYFDDLHLLPQLFHADLLITKLVHVSFPHVSYSPSQGRVHTDQRQETHRSRTMAASAKAGEP